MKRIGIAAFQTATNVVRLFRTSGRPVTFSLSAGRTAAGIASLLAVVFSAPIVAQTSTTPGISAATTAQTTAKKQPLDLELRSIAVLEWTGPTGKPTSSLLIPVAIYTDDHYQDGDNYLADPVPLAVQNGTQYILQRSGVPQGSYDLDAAGKLRGDWFGSGTWEPLNAPNPYAKAASSTGQGAVTANKGGDPDRPHFAASSDGADQDLPTLHLRPSKNAPKKPAPDPNRLVMAYGTPPQDLVAEFASTKTGPRQQMVAVSDPATRQVTDWAFPWANPAAKNAMHQQVELLAQRLLQRSMEAKAKADTAAGKVTVPDVQPVPDKTPRLVQRPAPKSATQTTSPTEAPTAATPVLPPLSNVDLRCFAFTPAKGSGPSTPTCVLTAESVAQGSPTQYVTVIAQPDIYGVPQSISQSITDATQLDTHPRVRMVDVLDAAANNQGDLLLELDRATERQFAIYKLSDGHVKLAYVTATLPF